MQAIYKMSWVNRVKDTHTLKVSSKLYMKNKVMEYWSFREISYNIIMDYNVMMYANKQVDDVMTEFAPMTSLSK